MCQYEASNSILVKRLSKVDDCQLCRIQAEKITVRTTSIEAALQISRDGTTFHDYEPAVRNPSLNVGIFQDPPQPNDAMYFGYHEDLHALLLTPEGLLLGDDGGVHRSTDGAKTFSAYNTGLADTEFYSGAVNRDGTALLTALAPDVPFVLLSSLAAREPQLSPYAASKRAAEEVLATYGVKSATIL